MAQDTNTPFSFKAKALAVVAGILAISGSIGGVYYQGTQLAGKSPETVDALADQIVDPAVNAEKLEIQGFYKVRTGGFYIDGCRKTVLSDDFNKGLSNKLLAAKINTCIVERMADMAARQHLFSPRM